MKAIIIVAIGSGLGGALRYGVQLFAARLLPFAFPTGTLIVNITGCFLIGVIFALTEKHNVSHEEAKLFLMTGFCGGFTTFSAFSIDSISLLRSGNLYYFFLYTLGSVALGIMATVIGMFVAKIF